MEKWRSGERLIVIKVVFVSFIFIFMFIIFTIYQEKIDLLPQYIDNLLLTLLNGDTWLRDRLIGLLIFLLLSIIFMLDLYKKFKVLSRMDKIVYWSRVIISISIFLWVLGMSFFTWSKWIYTLLNIVTLSQVFIFYLIDKSKNSLRKK